MTRDEVRTLMENCLGKCTSGPHGISYGPMRVEAGGGVAGHAQEWWIRFPGLEDSSLAAPVGPLRTKRELRAALRTKLHRIIRWAMTYTDLLDVESSGSLTSAP